MPCFFPSSDCGRGAHVLRVRSAPRSRLSRLLPFALWQVTSLQAKKQCSRRTTKHNFGCAFFFVRLRVCCSRTSCTLRYACSPFAIFNACSAPDYLFVSNTLRYACSPFAIFGVCSASACLLLLSGCGEVLTYLFVRSAPRPRLSRLLPFALWQVTSLQAKKQCSRRTTKARRFAVLFDIKSVDKRCVFRLLFYIRDRG